ncbi:hypothetical protein DTO271D3_8987 [Paecilomyces variotii]|nr:hypothetical protein DTO169C6_6333 [Paecilomyces variotii]KAJ9310733.1 hypothetical protein DTO271D3_8987 [Paecilomyces variotii]KAJ9352586.1 hypothetical protein DTO280E4_7708 [Paecilomyces variotii]KAJ9382146.1 hypothetical protein DTO063F5_5845 [Paecilomyces variotii]
MGERTFRAVYNGLQIIHLIQSCTSNVVDVTTSIARLIGLHSDFAVKCLRIRIDYTAHCFFIFWVTLAARYADVMILSKLLKRQWSDD